jgi:hypothetical protein
MKNFCKTLGIAAIMGVSLMMLHSCCKHNSSDDEIREMPIVMNTVQAGTKAIIDSPDSEERLKQMMNACYNSQGFNVGGFGVYGYKKAGTLDPAQIFNNTRVFPDADEPSTELKPWVYRPLRYWDKTASYQFIAYWPHLSSTAQAGAYVEAPHTVTTVDEEILTIHNIPNWQYANGSEMDLMTDVKVGRFDTDFTTGKVNFRFRHLLSQLIIKAYYVGTEYPVTVTDGVKSGGVRVNGITLTEYDPADAEKSLLKTGQTKFQVMDPNGKVDFTQTLQDVSFSTVGLGGSAVLLDNGNVYINYKNEMEENPNFVPATVGTWLMVPHRWYKLNLTVNDFMVGTETNSRISKTVPIQLGQLVYDYVTQPGRTYVITLLFNTLEGGLQVESVVEQTWTEHNVPRELYNL